MLRVTVHVEDKVRIPADADQYAEVIAKAITISIRSRSLIGAQEQ
jgi:hypothetical protein